ncbi:transposase [Pseudoalteromonas ulvae]|uniref:Transposase n=1 Tax=Pseudoalteromonas ulvae TaxID=107327 RepID=A0A244CL83_PSEDV|nr:transposase [Pseudoalteromonas ulvae]OUL56377.1 transposase [Pseudoalteromonas ulvae]
MVQARRSLIDLDSTPYYHCISRCVRRAFLAGFDKYSGQNFEHRRAWLVERFKRLSQVFAIDIAAYAVMSNHYHLVLRVDRSRALSWSKDEVIERWYQLYHGTILVDRYRKGEKLDEAYMYSVDKTVEVWRNRLYDISWYMRNLNEFIAREANKEDNCTGRFWEGRFKSQALLDEQAVLSCMMYVDLNPIRAKMAKTLQDSDFTSIQERIQHYKKQSTSENIEQVTQQPKQLMAFGSNENNQTIPFKLLDYLELADWSGRHFDPKKRGAISKTQPKILVELGIETAVWLEAVQNFRRQYSNFAGQPSALRQCAHQHQQSWYRGVG